MLRPTSVCRPGRVLFAVIVAFIAIAVAPATAQTPGTTPPSLSPSRNVRVAVTPSDPFVVKRGENYGGFSIELWEAIAARNHYATFYVEKPDVNAELDAVKSGDADIALGDITVSAQRSKTVDFTDITLPSGLQIMVAQGQQGTATALWTAITDSTVIVLLGFMLVAVVVASVVIWLLERGSNPEFAGKASDGVAEGTWWATVTMLTVGYGDRVPRTRGGRSFSILWMVFGMLIVAAVTATFTANLTVSRLNTPISSVDDLRDHSVVTVKDSVAAEALQARHINAQQVATTGEMVAAVRSGKVEAAVFDSPVLARAVHESSGNLALAGPPFTHSFDAFAVGPGSHLRTEVNGALLELLEDGSYDQIYRSWFAG